MVCILQLCRGGEKLPSSAFNLPATNGLCTAGPLFWNLAAPGYTQHLIYVSVVTSHFIHIYTQNCLLCLSGTSAFSQQKYMNASKGWVATLGMLGGPEGSQDLVSSICVVTGSPEMSWLAAVPSYSLRLESGMCILAFHCSCSVLLRAGTEPFRRRKSQLAFLYSVTWRVKGISV